MVNRFGISFLVSVKYREMPAYFCRHFCVTFQHALYGGDYCVVSNSVIPKDCQARAVTGALALYMRQPEMKISCFPKLPLSQILICESTIAMPKGYMTLMRLLRACDEQE